MELGEEEDVKKKFIFANAVAPLSLYSEIYFDFNRKYS